MAELFAGLLNLGFWSIFADIHGFLAMLSLVLFGAAFVLFFISSKNTSTIKWLKLTLLTLFIDITILDIFGLTVYIPYRATGGPRTLLKSSPATSWLHTIVFEHKEFTAFAPMILTFCAFFIVAKLGSSFSDNQNQWLRRSVLACLSFALAFVLVVAAEAVLVTKIAPVG